MSEQSSTDYNEHGMKPELPGQTILLLLLILYQVLEAALAMLYCLLLALPHAGVPKTATKKNPDMRFTPDCCDARPVAKCDPTASCGWRMCSESNGRFVHRIGKSGPS